MRTYIWEKLPVSPLVLSSSFAAQAGAILAMDLRSKGGDDFLKRKKDGSWLSGADSPVQAHVCKLLNSWLGGNGQKVMYFGEELVAEDVAPYFISPTNLSRIFSEHQVVVVDPIQNTKLFGRGSPHWDITFGGLQQGKPSFGLVYAPELSNTMCVAEKGRGVFLAKELEGASSGFTKLEPLPPWNRDFASLTVGYGHSISRHAKYRRFWDYLVSTGMELQEHVSTSYGLMAVAAGMIDVYIHGHTFGHDVLGGTVIAEENKRRVQLLRAEGDRWLRLPGLGEVKCFNLQDPSNELIAGDDAAVSLLLSKWEQLVLPSLWKGYEQAQTA